MRAAIDRLTDVLRARFCEARLVHLAFAMAATFACAPLPTAQEPAFREPQGLLLSENPPRPFPDQRSPPTGLNDWEKRLEHSLRRSYECPTARRKLERRVGRPVVGWREHWDLMS